MKRKTILTAALLGVLTFGSCQQSAKQVSMETSTPKEKALEENMTECKIRLGNLSFTQALNGADTCVNIIEPGKLEFRCTEKRDLFRDPNEKLTNNTIPILLSVVDNTKPFTFTAKVTPGFTNEGLYNAADLLVYANDTTWQKLCFEQDERGNRRIVTVRTLGTSDDNNHERLEVKTVYLRLSSDTRTLASYYSLDKKEWQMVRLYKNYYPSQIWVGIASQSPTSGICNSIFEEVSLDPTSVSDFRTGD